MTALTMIRGDRQRFRVTLADVDGVPLVLDDLELTFTVKRDFNDEDVVIQKTLADGIELGEGTGEAIVTVAPEDTEEIIRPRNYVWDFQVESLDGDVRTPLTGTLRIRHDVTRSVSGS